ncbi:MAG: hypothetical protein K2K00_04690, partial [Muribaculaceae bacterium]|nr:hypothetical protein [Muribaculaceae bacterium]
TVSEYLETIKKINKNYYNEGAVLCYRLDNKFRNIVEDLIPHIDSSKSKLSNGEKRQKEIADFMTKTIVDNDKWVSGLMEKMIYSLKNSH